MRCYPAGWTLENTLFLVVLVFCFFLNEKLRVVVFWYIVKIIFSKSAFLKTFPRKILFRLSGVLFLSDVKEIINIQHGWLYRFWHGGVQLPPTVQCGGE